MLGKRLQYCLGIQRDLIPWIVTMTLLALILLILRNKPRRTLSPPIPGADEAPSTIRIYDIHDLVDRWTSRGFIATPEALRIIDGDYTFPPLRPMTSEVCVNELLKAVSHAVDPPLEWRQNGGVECIEPMGEDLIISGPPETHSRVAAILHQIRAADQQEGP